MYLRKNNAISPLSKILLLSAVWIIFYAQETKSTITWERSYAHGIIFRSIQTSDGGYVSIGTTRVSIYFKIFILKVNSVGDSVWHKVYFSTQNNDYDGFWIEQTFDNGYIIAGSNNDAYIMKIDSAGNFQWDNSFGGGNLDQAHRIFQTADSGYIIGARTYSFTGTQQLYLIKTNKSGNFEWSKVFGSEIYFCDLIKLDNSGYLLMGYTNKLALFRTNLIGDTVFTKYNVSDCIGKSIRNTSDGGYIVGGETASPNENKCMTVKIDSVFNVQWDRIYAGIGREVIHNLELSNSKYVITGTTDSASNDNFRALVRIINLDGSVRLVKYYTPLYNPNNYAEFRSGIKTTDNGYLFSGSTGSIWNPTYIVKTDSLAEVTSSIFLNSNASPENFVLHQNYPNPFNPATTITVEVKKNIQINLNVFDSRGKHIVNLINKKLEYGNHNIYWIARDFPSGIYFYQVTAKDLTGKYIYIQTKKMILIK